MASPRYAQPFTEIRLEPKPMVLLPKLTDDERERLSQQREDEERVRLLEHHLSIAAQAVEEAQKMLRFPLDSVRMDHDDPR